MDSSDRTPISKKKKKLQVMPMQITFNLDKAEPLVNLTIKNPYDEEMAFKVKTNQPRRYFVKPNVEVVGPNSQKNVSILMKASDTRELYRKHRGSETISCSDQFLVQSVFIAEEFKAKISGAKEDTKKLIEVLQNMWKVLPKEQLLNTKVVCMLKIPSADPEWYSNPTGDDTAGSVAASPEPKQATSSSKGTIQYPVVSESANTSNRNEPVSVSRAAQSTDQSTSGAAADVSAARSGAATTGTGTEEMADLRKKYSELVNFAVQLTSERDRMKEFSKEKTQEIQRLETMLKNATEARQSEMVASGNSFTLWQLLLVAVIAFTVARLVT